MVKPLSRRKRIIFLTIFVVFFIILLPVVVLYSSGYRLDENWQLVKTGAVYIEVPYTGASLYVDDKLIGETGFLRNSFFVQDLTPKKYVIKVTKIGYSEWYKYLYVKEQVVSMSKSVIVPNNIEKIEIPQYLDDKDTVGSSSTKKNEFKNPEYSEIRNLFSTTTSHLSYNISSSTMDNPKSYEKMVIYSSDHNSIYVKWLGGTNIIPNVMCNRNDCDTEHRIFKASGLKHFDFFPERNDVIIYSDDTGVYVKDIDKKTPENKFTLSNKEDSDFRISENNDVYLKEDGKYYLLNLGQD